MQAITAVHRFWTHIPTVLSIYPTLNREQSLKSEIQTRQFKCMSGTKALYPEKADDHLLLSYSFRTSQKFTH